MKIFLILALMISFSALAQTRVKENIKSQALDSTNETQPAPVKKPKKTK